MKAIKVIQPFLFIALLLGTFSLHAQKATKTTETVCIEASMTCNGCKMKIEKEMAFEKGVKEVVADLQTKTVRIVYQSGKNSPQQLEAALKKLGFETRILGNDACPSAKS
jgi:periplasmic mercuric ion binding protein